MTADKKLLFSIRPNEFGPPQLHLYVGSTLIIPFKDVEEWKEFANDMLSMVPEMTENIETGNY
jgi:hypothetical protein